MFGANSLNCAGGMVHAVRCEHAHLRPFHAGSFRRCVFVHVNRRCVHVGTRVTDACVNSMHDACAVKEGEAELGAQTRRVRLQNACLPAAHSRVRCANRRCGERHCRSPPREKRASNPTVLDSVRRWRYLERCPVCANLFPLICCCVPIECNAHTQYVCKDVDRLQIVNLSLFLSQRKFVVCERGLGYCAN